MALSIDAQPELAPRSSLVSVPFAVRADTAVNVSGGVVDASEVRVGGNVVIDDSGNLTADDADTLADLGCSEDDVVKFIGGTWTCATDVVNTNASLLDTGTVPAARLLFGTRDDEIAEESHSHDLSTLSGEQLDSNVSGYLVPSGLIAMFMSDCPSGWSTVSELAGRIARGEPTGDASSLDQGGSDDAIVVEHLHSVTGETARRRPWVAPHRARTSPASRKSSTARRTDWSSLARGGRRSGRPAHRRMRPR